MKPVRVLVLSGSRPSRSWKIAERIRQEICGAEICAIVQAPFALLAPTQQWMAQGADPCLFSSRRKAKVARWLRSMLESLLHWALWCIHGCPRDLNLVKRFTIQDLADKCRQIGCGFFLAGRCDTAALNQFVQDHADLVVALGDLSLETRLWAIPKHGMVRAYQSDADGAVTAGQEVHINIEFFGQDCTAPCALVSLDIPVQPYDGPLGLTLKSDLITDDLLMQTVKLLQAERPEHISKKLEHWMHRIISPYLAQLENAANENAPARPPLQRFRRVWSLLLDTLLLCSPILIARNWYRRWRGRYPVLILTHHLVSDRPHSMGISTERFWRQLHFLRRHYRLVSMADAEQVLRVGGVTLPTAVVTFDDGYRDNFVNLRAVADEMDIPIILFVSTKPVEYGKEFQHDLVQRKTGYPALTWDQILYWHSCGAEFGSHTRTHLDCGSADQTILHEEIVGSKLDLEGRLGKRIAFFAFPFGKTENMSKEAMQIAASAYSLCLTALDGENLPFVSQPLPPLFRKGLYPNCWELELELQSIFLLVNCCRQKLRMRWTRLRRKRAAAYSGPPSGELSSGRRDA